MNEILILRKQKNKILKIRSQSSMPLFNLLQGMDAIEKLEPGGFTEYLKNSKNTICGRHPIGVLLNVSVFFF